MVVSEHAALRHSHSGRIGDDRLFERDFRSVGETGDHRGRLPPALRETDLSRRIPIRILQALDVAHETGNQAQALHVAEQVDFDSGLIAIASG